MIKLKYLIIWGSVLDEIRILLDQTDEMYLGLFINSLRYDNEVQGKEEKSKYIFSLKNQIEKINKKVKTFNEIRKFAFGEKSKLTKLSPINFSRMRVIVLKHKGDYPREKGLSNFTKELLGTSDSASSLARKHTALLLRNTLMPLRIELGRFVESLKTIEEPYQEFYKNEKRYRKIVSKEIEKSVICYSVDLKGEAVFIIGRLLENLCTEWLLHLKKEGSPQLKAADVGNLDFDQKLNRLHYNLKKISPNQYSKAMALKWDRNTFGHKIGRLNEHSKDADSNIRTGINLITHFELKVNRKNRTAIPKSIKMVE
ncbi:MAG: hypothetical protein WC648_02815 [Candidatus Paceibacterota bacterium]|jgi:hypothetical protein